MQAGRTCCGSAPYTMALPSAARSVRADAIVLCPGGYDRQLPIPGWDLPGVMAAGGVQALLKGHGVVPGRRAVVAGTGPFLLPVATGLAAAGVEVVSVCEAGAPSSWLRHPAGILGAPSKLVEGAGYAAALLRSRIPYRPRTAIIRIHGDHAVEAVTIAQVDRRGRPMVGTERELAVDLVGLGWGFTPSLELVLAAGADTRLDVDGSLVAWVDDRQRSSQPGVYVAGEATGVGGARLALREGELAALTAAEDAGLPSAPRRTTRLRRAIRRGRAFARAMHRAHPVPSSWSEWLDDDTTVCRCEEVTAGDIRHAREDLGARRPAHRQAARPAGDGLVPGAGVRLRHRLPCRRLAAPWTPPTSGRWPAARSARRSRSASWPTWPTWMPLSDRCALSLSKGLRQAQADRQSRRWRLRLTRDPGCG